MRFALAGAPLSRRVRLWGGLTLFSYVLLHLSNHALGLMLPRGDGTGAHLGSPPWRSPPGMVLLYSALITHLGLGLWALTGAAPCGCRPGRPRSSCSASPSRRSCSPMSRALVLTDALLGTTPSYARVLLFLWVFDPMAGRASGRCLLLIAWIHGCMGLHFWLRFRRWYPRVALAFFAAALLVPVLALLGFAAGARGRRPSWPGRRGSRAI